MCSEPAFDDDITLGNPITFKASAIKSATYALWMVFEGKQDPGNTIGSLGHYFKIGLALFK